MHEQPPPSSLFPLQAALFEAGLAFSAVLFGWIFGQPPTRSLQLNLTAVLLGILAVVPLLGLLVVCARGSWRPILEIRRILDDLIVPMFKSCTWIELASISLLAGVGEELLFRGVFQAAIVEWSGNFLPHSPVCAAVGDWLAVIVVAIVFGMMHAVNVAYAILAALMGLYLGWLWMATGNLAVPIVAHALYDFLALGYILRWRNPEKQK